MEPKTTAQVAEQLGVSRSALFIYLNRNPHLRPAIQARKSGPLSWTDEEIAAIREAKAGRKVGRPKKQ